MSHIAETTQETASHEASMGFEGFAASAAQFRFATSRPGSGTIQAMQAAASQSPRVTQLKALQSAINQGNAPLQRSATALQFQGQGGSLAGPLTEAELDRIRNWRSFGEVTDPGLANPAQLGPTAPFNHAVIANAIMYQRFVDNGHALQEGGEADPGMSRSSLFQDPQWDTILAHVEAIGPVINWQDTTLETRNNTVMERLIEEHGVSPEAAAGLAGNLTHESGLIPNRIERTSEADPMTSCFHPYGSAFSSNESFDASYERIEEMDGATGDPRTGCVTGITDYDNDGDNNGITNWTAEQVAEPRSNIFATDNPGFGGVGLAQWTYWNRRDGLFGIEEGDFENGAFTDSYDKSNLDIMFDMDGQVDYAVSELDRPEGVADSLAWTVMTREGVTVEEASDAVLRYYLKPGIIIKSYDPPETWAYGENANADAIYNERRNLSREALEMYRADHPEEQEAGTNDSAQ